MTAKKSRAEIFILFPVINKRITRYLFKIQAIAAIDWRKNTAKVFYVAPINRCPVPRLRRLAVSGDECFSLRRFFCFLCGGHSVGKFLISGLVGKRTLAD